MYRSIALLLLAVGSWTQVHAEELPKLGKASLVYVEMTAGRTKMPVGTERVTKHFGKEVSSVGAVVVFELGEGTADDIEVLEEFLGIEAARVGVSVSIADKATPSDVVKACEDAGLVLVEKQTIDAKTQTILGLIRPAAYGALTKARGVKAVSVRTGGRAG